MNIPTSLKRIPVAIGVAWDPENGWRWYWEDFGGERHERPFRWPHRAVQ